MPKVVKNQSTAVNLTAVTQNNLINSEELMQMTDFHSHILPGIDDGCKNVEESIEVLKMMASQGIDRVAATPHFYASNSETPDEFLVRRENAKKLLFERMESESDLPEIFCGAEVKYFRGMSGVEELTKLTLEGTDLLLVEMPFHEWSSTEVKEVISLNEKLGVTPMLAHIERFLSYQKKDWLYELKQADVLIQMNAEYILGTFSGHKAMKLIKNRAVDFLGSDTHNTTDRKPNLGPALLKIEKKAGEEYIDRFLRIEDTYAPYSD